MMMEYYVTRPVNSVTNVLFLILLNCIASRTTMGRIVSNSHSNMLHKVVMLESIFFWLWRCIDCFAALYQGILNRSWKCEVGDLKMGVWKYWWEYLKMVEQEEIPRKSWIWPCFPPQQVPVHLWSADTMGIPACTVLLKENKNMVITFFIQSMCLLTQFKISHL